MSSDARNEMLRCKFWTFLHSEKLKSQTRHKFDNVLSFEHLIREIRVVEHEMSLNPHTGATKTGSQTKRVQQIAVSADSSDIECRLKSLELRVDKQYNALTQRLDQVLSALPNNRPPQQRPY